MHKVLFVLTNVGWMESARKPTGWYLPELCHVYDILAPHYEIVFASPKGGLAPVDPGSIELFKEDPSCVNFLKHMSNVWHNTIPLNQFLGHIDEFVAVFFPGGHGPMFDLRVDPHVHRIIADFYKAGKHISAVCHGTIVLSEVVIDGEPLVKGKKVTGFTDAEEEAVGLTDVMPVLLETQLIKKGANFYKAGEVFQEQVVTDGQFITGQNPASAKPMGRALLDALLSEWR